ncbi:hypothetical protein SAURM35S_00618 [Streptomyces aurantiogriseus]
MNAGSGGRGGRAGGLSGAWSEAPAVAGCGAPRPTSHPGLRGRRQSRRWACRRPGGGPVVVPGGGPVVGPAVGLPSVFPWPSRPPSVTVESPSSPGGRLAASHSAAAPPSLRDRRSPSLLSHGLAFLSRPRARRQSPGRSSAVPPRPPVAVPAQPRARSPFPATGPPSVTQPQLRRPSATAGRRPCSATGSQSFPGHEPAVSHTAAAPPSLHDRRSPSLLSHGSPPLPATVRRPSRPRARRPSPPRLTPPPPRTSRSSAVPPPSTPATRTAPAPPGSPPGLPSPRPRPPPRSAASA